MPTKQPRRPLALILLAAAIGALAGQATPADARKSKPAGPLLKIESKACNTGTDDDTRSIVLTASAVLRGDGDEVQMRFRVQQRPKTKTKWRTVFAKTGDLGTWATSVTSLCSPLLIVWSMRARSQPALSLSSQATRSRTSCTRTQPELKFRPCRLKSVFTGVSCR